MKGKYGTDEEWLDVPELDNQTDVYNYRDAEGNISFQKVKLEWFDGVNGGRTGKSFLYRSRCDVRSRCDWVDWDTGVVGLHLGKPERAESLLYHLPEVLAGIREGKTIWLAEGERDSDLWQEAIGGEGVCTTMHGGAEVGPGMLAAKWLQGYSDVRVLMDNDSAGAWCAYRWAELLRWNVYVYRPLDEWKDIGEALLATKGWEKGAGAGKELIQKVDPRWLVEKAEEHRAKRKEAWGKRGKGKKVGYEAGERLGK